MNNNNDTIIDGGFPPILIKSFKKKNIVLEKASNLFNVKIIKKNNDEESVLKELSNSELDILTDY